MPHDGQTGVYFDSGGYRLLGTLFLAHDDSPKPTAIILHGLPGIEKNYDLALALREAGWNSLIFHYRGCWGSAGHYTLRTIPRDVRAAMDYLSSGAHPQVDAGAFYLVGHSLGGWAAILGAVDDGRVCGVAIYGAVTDPRSFPLSLADANEWVVDWLTGIFAEDFVEQWAALGDDFAPVEQVGRLACPLLIVHSEADETVPVGHARALHNRAQGPCELRLHPDANHSFTWHRDWLQEQIVGWLHSSLMRR